MRPSARTLFHAALLLLIVGISGCGGGSSSPLVPAGPVASTPKQTGALVLTLTTPKTTYARGEAVPFTFTVKNVGTQPADVYTIDNFFQTIISHAGQIIDVFPGANGDTFVHFTLAPGESTSETATWDQTDPNKPLVSAGQYTIDQQVPAGQYTVSSYVPVESLNGMMLIHYPPSNEWSTFWQANYASIPIPITIR